ncbi:signal peptidase I [Conexibacter sp. W3-3-2]|uniref:signal peptidase I n=1 Tax=Conexibacter sp. W3-3-2 TaxID=2675227 RepID=UPI0013208031|nr:signal peptidase I [Conexibacter sp. W3-3-2]MTD43455.1 signal peptidase I [Conexibacter sp. W3-3-2]
MAKSEKSAGGSILETVVIVAVAIGLALAIQAFIVKPYRIPSESMVPTLTVGQRVLVNRLGNNFSDPSVGDVVVFHPPSGSESNTCGNPQKPEDQACDKPTGDRADVNFIKRVVGVGGDRISIRDGHVFRNGKREKDDYIRACGDGQGCDLPRTFTVPAGHFFMMGDNRGESDDSRFWGPVPKKWIIGGAFATYWPPKRIGLL